MNVIETSIADLYMKHALSPEEVRTALEHFLLLIEPCQITRLSPFPVSGSSRATFNLRLTFMPDMANSHFVKTVVKTLPDNSPLQHENQTRYETMPAYLICLDHHGLQLRLLPKTRDMLKVLKDTFGRSGITELEDAVIQFEEMAPVDRLFIDANLLPPYLHDGTPGKFPRCYAEFGHGLRTVGNVPADEVPLYCLREMERIDASEYPALPRNVIDHIDPLTYLKETPHLAVKGPNQGKVAYTESTRKGGADVQSVMKPGKYLRRVLKDKVDDQALKTMVADMQSHANYEVKIVSTPDEVAEVYMKGPQSCMSHGKDRFGATYDTSGQWYHPIEALFWKDGSGDIQLVYVDIQGRPAARALVNTENMEYPSIYGCDWAPSAKNSLESWLESNGYRQEDSALAGAKIPRIDLGNGAILCPYIDCNNLGVEIYNDHLIVSGEYEADHSTGFIDPDDVNSRDCDDCYEPTHEDDLTYVDRSDHRVCQSCLDDYVLALTDMDVEWVREMDCEYIGSTRMHDGTSFEHVHESASDSDIEHEGLCRLPNGDIEDMGNCLRVESTAEWIHTDDVRPTSYGPSRNLPVAEPYILVDTGEVHPTDECVWMSDRKEWWHRDDISDDEHITEHRFNYQTA
jgi:hypothetical protein